MKRVIKLLTKLGCGLFLLMASQTASAIPLNILFQGGSIQVYDKLFDNWRLATNSVSGGDSLGRTSFDLSNINVTGEVSGGALNPGLVFTPLGAETSITQTGGVTTQGQLTFQFDVTVLDPLMRWSDNTLATTFDTGNSGSSGNNRSAHMHELLFTDSTLSDSFGDKDTHYENDDAVGFSLIGSDSLNFPGRTSGTVLTDLSLEVHSDGESVGVTRWQMNFSQSEAATVPTGGSTGLMLAVGLLGLAVCKRRVKTRTL